MNINDRKTKIQFFVNELYKEVQWHEKLSIDPNINNLQQTYTSQLPSLVQFYGLIPVNAKKIFNNDCIKVRVSAHNKLIAPVKHFNYNRIDEEYVTLVRKATNFGDHLANHFNNIKYKDNNYMYLIDPSINLSIIQIAICIPKSLYCCKKLVYSRQLLQPNYNFDLIWLPHSGQQSCKYHIEKNIRQALHKQNKETSIFSYNSSTSNINKKNLHCYTNSGEIESKCDNMKNTEHALLMTKNDRSNNSSHFIGLNVQNFQANGKNYKNCTSISLIKYKKISERIIWNQESPISSPPLCTCDTMYKNCTKSSVFIYQYPYNLQEDKLNDNTFAEVKKYLENQHICKKCYGLLYIPFSYVELILTTQIPSLINFLSFIPIPTNTDIYNGIPFISLILVTKSKEHEDEICYSLKSSKLDYTIYDICVQNLMAKAEVKEALEKLKYFNVPSLKFNKSITIQMLRRPFCFRRRNKAKISEADTIDYKRNNYAIETYNFIKKYLQEIAEVQEIRIMKEYYQKMHTNLSSYITI